MRAFPGDHQAVGAGWLGPVRLLRQPLALVLGAAAAPGLHPARPAGRLRAGRRQGRERQVLLGMLAADSTLLASRAGQTLITDKNYYGTAFEAELTARGVRLLRPARQGEP